MLPLPAGAAFPFVSIPLRPRFFQASAFFPMPVVLLATVNADGTPNLAPYSLCFPHVTPEGHRLALVMRQASKSAENLVRTGRVSVSFIPDRPELMANCKVLGQPLSSAEKMAKSVFTLVPSPRPDAPPLVGEAVQVFECRLVASEVAFEAGDGTPEEHRFVLEVEAIHMAPLWAEVLESGGRGPRLPVDYGFRRGSATWMSRPGVVTSGPRIRPVFEVAIDRPPARVVAEFKAALAHPEAPIVGKIRGDVLQLGLPARELTTWSPSVDLRVDPSPPGASDPTGSIVRGRIGPQPQVWTTFMFFHMMIALIGLGGLMWGVAALTAGGSGWPLWIAAGAVFMHAFVAGAAFIGQGLGADQTFKLRSFIDQVLDP